MKTSTIQVFEDVKARLEEEREDKKESLNDILRRLLDMDEPKDPFEGMIPRGCKAEIIEKCFVFNESKNWAFLESLNMSDNEKQDLMCGNFGISTKINGINVRFSLESTLELELEAKTEDELCQRLRKVKEALPFELDKKQVTIWNCYQSIESTKIIKEIK